MALTLETGEGLPDSDAFVSLSDVRDFATSRGATVSDDDAVLEGKIRAANDYLVAIESRLQGWRSQEDQALPFPRAGVVLYGRELSDDTIPKCLKDAICLLVIETQEREALPTADGRVVISETVGPLSTTYAQTGATAASPVFPQVDAYLAPLLRSGGALTSLRV